MKLSNANKVRERYLSAIMTYFTDEDIGKITSNSFNFPIVEDGEEGWVEIVVKVPKDGGDDGYAKREEYAMKIAEKAEKAKAAAEAKAKKIAKDKTKRKTKEGK